MTEEIKGGFTLPGESGYEALTLELAKKWGADVIRDSDGTALSEEIVNAGYGIYSTICIIRDHNAWAEENPDMLQQSFLMTSPKTAVSETLRIVLMEDYFEEQFSVNESAEALPFMQVYDRTTETLLPGSQWTYAEGTVTLSGVIPWHRYTVSFLAYRIWEEISMYNHTTNHWDKEHLKQIDPIHTKTQEYMLDWMKSWCESHPETTVVHFTSMFYNFVWIWGSNPRNRHLYSDWGSYDFTVSPQMLLAFEREYGYSLTAEDFVNQGKLHVTHMPTGKHQRDYMDFVNRFVVSFGRKLVDIVHTYGKKAYVFYDDSWVGIEPYQERFQEFGFDGLIKCVFSGFEARLCAGVPVDTHELRLHPYLFPVGLGGAPTFSENGDPTLEAKKFWNSIRRALLREPVERIGLGGYLHLVEPYPDFCDYIEAVAEEFRRIRALHGTGKPYSLLRVAVLHSWGKLRSWTLSGHFHETYMHDLIHINEALSGLPVEVSFVSFEDVKAGALQDVQVLINAGAAKTAWSGGDAWRDAQVVETITEWVYHGGCVIGVGEPSAVPGFDTYFRLSGVLGVDLDLGERVCHGRWSFEPATIPGLMPVGSQIRSKAGIYLTDGLAAVLAERDGLPVLTAYPFGQGKGIWMASFEQTPANTRMLLNIMLYGTGKSLEQNYLTDCADTECAWYPDSRTLVVINNSEKKQVTAVHTESGLIHIELEAFETKTLGGVV